MNSLFRFACGTHLIPLVVSTCWLTEPSLVYAQVGPSIVSTVPTSGATGVLPDAPVVFTFSAAMNTSLTSAQFVDASGFPPTVLPSTPSWSGDLKQLNCTPNPSFPANKMVLWVVTGEDQSGNALQGTTAGFFTTGSSGGPGTGTNIVAGLVSRGELAEQVDTNLLQTTALEIVALAGVNPTNSVALTAPPPGVTNTLQDAGVPGVLEFSDTEGDALAFATNYPAGNYQFTLATLAGTSTAVLNLPDGALPPAPRVADWHNPPYCVLGQPWLVQWDFASGGAAVDYVRLRVEQSGAVIFATPLAEVAGALTGMSNALVVPASVFTNGARCEVSLSAFSFTALDTNSIPGATLRAARHRTTTFELRVADPSVPPPTLLTTNLAALPVDDPILMPLRATNGVRPLEFELISGALPAGLVLESGGAISGQALSISASSATVRVTDLLGRSSTQTLAVATAPSDSTGAAPRLVNVQLAGATAMSFDLLGSAGVQYTVERSLNLSNWTTFLTTNAASERVSLRVAIDTARAFFRARGPGAPPPPTPHPLTVAPVLNTNAVATAQLDELGGTLSLTNAGGYVFALKVPIGALDRAETIMMTEVAEIGGLPLSGGLRAAVDLQPEGVMFSAPARLDITAPANLNAALVTGFGARSDGSQFALQPAFNTNRTVSLYLWHFSLAGMGEGTAADAQAQSQNAPDDPMASSAQQVTSLLQACKANPDCSTESISGELCEAYKNMADGVVLPKLKAAVADDAVLDDALGTWLRWLKDLALLGLYDGDLFGNDSNTGCLGNRVVKAGNLAAQALRNAMNKACQRCMEHQVWQIYRMMDLARQAALLGLDYEGSFWECARKCLVFELQVESEITGSEGGYVVSARAKGKAKLRPMENDVLVQLKLLFSGSGQWPITDLQQPSLAGGCFWETAPAPGRLLFPWVNINLYRKREVWVPGQGPVTSYVFDPDMTVYMRSELSLMPKENRVVVCPKVGPTPVSDGFGQWFNMFHNQEVVVPSGLELEMIGGAAFRFTGFTGSGAGDVILSKPYSQTYSELTEDTLIELRHTPGN